MNTEGEGAVREMTFKERVDYTRQSIKQIAKDVYDLKETKQNSENVQGENIGEVMANLTLSYRCLEDGSMRLGKVLQHLNGGDSKYDHSAVGDPNGNESQVA